MATSTMQVNILQARNNLSQLIKLVQADDEVIIANRGAPVAQLVAIKSKPDHQAAVLPIALTGIVAWLKLNPLPKHLQRRHADIQAGIDAERAAWD